MKCLLRFTDRANRKNLRLDPQEVAFLNPNSLVFIDDKFFLLPLPDIARMEKLRLSVNVTADPTLQDRKFEDSLTQ